MEATTPTTTTIILPGLEPEKVLLDIHRHHDLDDYGSQSKGRYYDLPTISVRKESEMPCRKGTSSVLVRCDDCRGEVESLYAHSVALILSCLPISDDVGRAAADSFRLQVGHTHTHGRTDGSQLCFVFAVERALPGRIVAGWCRRENESVNNAAFPLVEKLQTSIVFVCVCVCVIKYYRIS